MTELPNTSPQGRFPQLVLTSPYPILKSEVGNSGRFDLGEGSKIFLKGGDGNIAASGEGGGGGVFELINCLYSTHATG